jgi:hypothetical protein
MHCEHCGKPLACFENEWYCPDCTRYETEAATRRADDEARALRLVALQDDGDGPAKGELSF